MKNIGVILVSIIIFSSCHSVDDNQVALEASQAVIKELQEKINRIEDRPSKILTHDVYFDLKDDLSEADISRFETGLRSLSKVDAAKALKVGRGADTGDKRLVSNYDFVLSMYFESQKDLEKYANDEFHLGVRKEIGPMLEKAPVVYDSWVE